LSNASHWEKPAVPLSLNRFPREAMIEMRRLSLLSWLRFCRRLHRRPDYKRPAARFPAPIAVTKRLKRSRLIGDQKWWDVFRDEQLQSLIRTALSTTTTSASPPPASLTPRPNSASRAPTNFLPSTAVLDFRLNAPQSLPSSRRSSSLTVNFLFPVRGKLDFWGKYRRATEAARASLLASEWGRRAVVSSLVASVASSYFQLRALDLQLEISKKRAHRPSRIASADHRALRPW